MMYVQKTLDLNAKHAYRATEPNNNLNNNFNF